MNVGELENSRIERHQEAMVLSAKETRVYIVER